MATTPPSRFTSSDDGNAAQWREACAGESEAGPRQFREVTDVLLERPQLNSTHLFRADIFHDSAQIFKTIHEKEIEYIEQNQATLTDELSKDDHAGDPKALAPPTIEFFIHVRTVVRRLIPRKPQLDKPLDQTCFVFEQHRVSELTPEKILVIYAPHCSSAELMPWYHPKIQRLAYLYERNSETDTATVSVHYIPFSETPNPLPDRLQRTFQGLLGTLMRLLRMPARGQVKSNANQDKSNISALEPPSLASSLKTNIVPQHIVQNTYTRLKQIYAPTLIENWVENTDPSKHVFEDLGIAALLIELWTGMYGSPNTIHNSPHPWTGFVDLACGNGVLTWLLTMEGWSGYGFDARARHSWEMLHSLTLKHNFSLSQPTEPKTLRLEERVCIPEPFITALSNSSNHTLLDDLDFHNGIFPAGTFIISNHADELTPWTPLLAALSSSSNSPLPFLAIPCCSHALDGSKRRYNPKDLFPALPPSPSTGTVSAPDNDDNNQDANNATGDLKALRQAQQKARLHKDDKSMYACLTRKTEQLAREIGADPELLLVRIPSTRNIGIIGGRRRGVAGRSGDLDEQMEELVERIVQRECVATGGVEKSARTWVEKCRRLGVGSKGKANCKGQGSGCSIGAGTTVVEEEEEGHVAER